MCTCPLPALRHGDGSIEFLQRSAKERFLFGKYAPIQIPCGQCIECRLKRAREWGVRCMHEASLHRQNCFLTLTYSDDKLLSPSLKYKDFQDFLKRLRRRIPEDHKILHFTCGEYGETNPVTGVKDGGIYRPHFHSILFNYNFDDRVPCRALGQSHLYSSKFLDSVWTHGACRIGAVTFESCSYVARYAMKKVNGDLAKEHYMIVMPDGECIEREPEMLRMSLKPAIGKAWFDRFGRHAYSRDSVIVRGVEMQPPRYYDKLLPEIVRGMVNDERSKKGGVRRADHTDERNNVRDVVVTAGFNQFKRD